MAETTPRADQRVNINSARTHEHRIRPTPERHDVDIFIAQAVLADSESEQICQADRRNSQHPQLQVWSVGPRHSDAEQPRRQALQDYIRRGDRWMDKTIKLTDPQLHIINLRMPAGNKRAW